MQTYSYRIEDKQTFNIHSYPIDISELRQRVNILPLSSRAAFVLRSSHCRRILIAVRKSVCKISWRYLRHTKIISQCSHLLIEIFDGIFIDYIIRSFIIISSVIILIVSPVHSRLFNHILLFVRKVRFF